MQKFFGCANPQFHQLSSWLVSDDPPGEEARCGGPNWRGYTRSADVRPVGRTAKFSKTMLEAAYVREINILATALVAIPTVSMPIARSLKTRDICGIVLCDKTAHFRVAFLLFPAQGVPVQWSSAS